MTDDKNDHAERIGKLEVRSEIQERDHLQTRESIKLLFERLEAFRSERFKAMLGMLMLFISSMVAVFWDKIVK